MPKTMSLSISPDTLMLKPSASAYCPR
jgi:hypothetical protein